MEPPNPETAADRFFAPEPSPGRVVMYQIDDTTARPATVISCWKDRPAVDRTVFTAMELMKLRRRCNLNVHVEPGDTREEPPPTLVYVKDVDHDGDGQRSAGHWWWPEIIRK